MQLKTLLETLGPSITVLLARPSVVPAGQPLDDWLQQQLEWRAAQRRARQALR